MAAKQSPLSIYPEPELLEKIEEMAKDENRGKGPMVLEIVRRYFQAAALDRELGKPVVKKKG